MTNRLKPCPFCGAEPIVTVEAEPRENTSVKNFREGYRYEVYCPKCPVSSENNYSLESVCKQWNSLVVGLSKCFEDEVTDND